MTPDELRDEVSMWDLLELLEIDYELDGRGEAFIYAIDREENTASLHVSDRLWYDFGSGEGGDIFKFLMQYEGVSFARAKQILSRMEAGGLTSSPAPKVERPVINFREKLQQDAGPLPSKWLRDKIHEKWGLTWLTLGWWGVRVGPGDSLVIPHWDSGREVCNMVHVRDLTPGSKRPKYSYKGSRATRLYHNAMRPGPIDGPWVLVEGESDAWTMDAMDVGDVIAALPSGAGSIDMRWFEKFPGPFIAFPDHGEAGDKMAAKLKAMFGDRCTIGTVPGTDDVNAAYRDGYRLRLKHLPSSNWTWSWEMTP